MEFRIGPYIIFVFYLSQYILFALRLLFGRYLATKIITYLIISALVFSTNDVSSGNTTRQFQTGWHVPRLLCGKWPDVRIIITAWCLSVRGPAFSHLSDLAAPIRCVTSIFSKRVYADVTGTGWSWPQRWGVKRRNSKNAASGISLIASGSIDSTEAEADCYLHIRHGTDGARFGRRADDAVICLLHPVR